MESENGEIFIGKQHEFRKLVNRSVGTVNGFVMGRQKTCAGWRIIEGLRNGNPDKTKNFVTITKGDISFSGSISHISKISGVNKNGLRAAFYRDQSEYKGWRIDKIDGN